MKRETWLALAGVLAAFVGGVFLGRSSVPEVPARVVDVERVSVREDTAARARVAELTAELETAKRNTRTEVITLEKPDGTRETRKVRETQTERRTEAKAEVKAESETKATREVETVRTVEITREVRPDWRVGALVQFAPRPAYGALVERRIVGPFSLGLFALVTPGPLEFRAGALLTVEF